MLRGLLTWNTPLGIASHGRSILSPDYSGMSLFEAHSCNTPSDLEMLTPSDGAQSPWDMRVYEKDRQNLTRVVREQRMDLFIKGRFADLLNTMSNSERM